MIGFLKAFLGIVINTFVVINFNMNVMHLELCTLGYLVSYYFKCEYGNDYTSFHKSFEKV